MQERVILQITTTEEQIKRGEFQILSTLPPIETCLVLLTAIGDILYKQRIQEVSNDDKRI
ncbi:MAG: hypothetical protein QXU79_01555 [Candidatus Micrarchaeaceae archaeon]